MVLGRDGIEEFTAGGKADVCEREEEATGKSEAVVDSEA